VTARASAPRPPRRKGGLPATKGDRRESVADDTRRYIDGHPSIRDCLLYDIVNFTALARRIRTETHLSSQEAIEIACRRYRRQMQREPGQEEQLRAVLVASHVEIRTHVAVVTVRGDLDSLERIVVGAERLLSKRSGLVQLFQGSGLVTILCEESLLSAILNVIPRTSILHLERRLSVLSVRSPEEVLVTPRVLGYLAEAIGRAGINCVEMMSVHTDTLFVLRADDAIRAFQIYSDISRALTPEDEDAKHGDSTPDVRRIREAVPSS
jgi:hypothetical protein